MKKIAILEDHSLLRTSFVNLINDEDHYKVCLEAKNGDDFMRKLNPKEMPDVVLVDVEMPIMDGPQTIRTFRKKYGKKVKLLGLSVHKEIRLVKEMLHEGANGYISKAASADELFQAIDKVTSVGFYLSKDISQIINISGSVQHRDDVLNEKEEKILLLICQERVNKEIAESLEISVNTVNTYRTRMIEKLGVKNSVGLVLYAVRMGIHKIS